MSWHLMSKFKILSLSFWNPPVSGANTANNFWKVSLFSLDPVWTLDLNMSQKQAELCWTKPSLGLL